MASDWSLELVLEELHASVENDLHRARKTISHPTDKGDATESVWRELLNRHLPKRYEARKAHVVDSTGAFSDQIDIVILDRQYSPLIFEFHGTSIIPVESVYAVLEAKQLATAETVRYAQTKARSVRTLRRTSLPVTTIDGVRPAKQPQPILAGLLALSSEWKDGDHTALRRSLASADSTSRLDIGCIADRAYWTGNDTDEMQIDDRPRAATRFLFELIATLQEVGTVPSLDARAYAAKLRI